MNEGNFIGGGQEKTVHLDPKNESRVVKRYIEQKTGENIVRARFYFGKILHTLFPKNFPDIHQSTTKPNQVVMDRVALDSEHVAIQEILRRLRESGGEMNDEDSDTFLAFTHERSEDLRVKDLIEQLDTIGVKYFDQAYINFSVDGDSALYVDNIHPWLVDQVSEDGLKYRPGIVLNFNLDTVRQAIQDIRDDSLRKHTEEFLERILVLYKEEKEKFDKERADFLMETEQ